jgi:hypothetical protein
MGFQLKILFRAKHGSQIRAILFGAIFLWQLETFTGLVYGIETVERRPRSRLIISSL